MKRSITQISLGEQNIWKTFGLKHRQYTAMDCPGITRSQNTGSKTTGDYKPRDSEWVLEVTGADITYLTRPT